MATPAIIGLVVFLVGPMMASALLSLSDWAIGATPSFVGVENYQRLFRDDPLFWRSLWVTLYYTILTVPGTLIVAMIIALLLNRRIRGLVAFRAIYYLPTLVPLVASAILWNWLFNPDFGLFNEILKGVGMTPSKWIFDQTTVMPSLAMMGIWGFGNVMVIFLAGLQGVPMHLYEAVALDGGNGWHKFFHVTIPMMSPIIFFTLVTGVVAAVQSFHQAYLMTYGGPNNASTFIVYYLYETAFTRSLMGYASALAWIVFTLCGLLTLALFRWARQWVHYSMERD